LYVSIEILIKSKRVACSHQTFRSLPDTLAKYGITLRHLLDIDW
jgi:hypothetical protein